jgi:hypothetical protein
MDRWTLRGAYGIMYEGDLFNGFSGTPLGKQTNVQAGGAYLLAADPVTPWTGIFNWDSGFPTSRYQPAAYDASYGNKNQPGMIDPSYGRSPYTQQWNFNIQRELARNLVLDVGYVGNKATGIRAGQLAVLNQLDPKYLQQYGRTLNNAIRSPADAAANGVRYPYPGFQGTVASALRPYPQVQGNQTVANYGAPLGHSTYHSLQLVLNRQFARGFTAYTNYTWSKNLTNVQSSQVNDNAGRPLDYYNLKLEKSYADDDQPHIFKAYLSYDLPFGRGKALLGSGPRIVNAIVGGWSISGIFNYFSGTPLGFAGSSPLSGAWNGVTNRANVAPGDLKNSAFDKEAFQISPVTSPSNTLLDKSKFSDPAALTLGTGAFRYGNVRNFATRTENFGLQKNTKIGENIRFQLRAEFLNAFNRGTLGGIQTGVTNVQFGQVTSIGGNRQVQLGTRLDF